jgi:hypothetical protein
MTGPTQRAIHDLRRVLTAAATACDEVLYGQPGAISSATRRLPGLLDQLAVRLERVRLALDREGLR